MKTIIIGERYKEKLDNPLKNHGFTPFWLKNNPNIDIRLSSHSDLSVFMYGNTVILASYLKNECRLVNFLTNRGFSVIISQTTQGSVYPDDINLCAAVVGNKLLHNLKYTDSEILGLGLDCININQGYARCSALVLNDTSIITADNGIQKAAFSSGIDVLKLSCDDVSLEGYDRGFIGGAAFRYKNVIYFTGDITLHPNAAQIIEYIKERNMNYICLTDEPMFDIGGAVAF